MRNFMLATITFAAVFLGTARADSPPAVTTSVDNSVDCRKIDPSKKEVTRSELQTAQLCQEVTKLKEEVLSIQQTNRSSRGLLGQLTPLSGLISAGATLLVGALGTILGFWFRSSFEKTQLRKLEQERMLDRERHNLELLKGLDSGSRSVQLATVSALLKRIEQVRTQNIEGPTGIMECVTVSDVIVSILRDPNLDEAVAKFVADELVDALGARKSPKDKPEKVWRRSLPKRPPPFPLSDLNFQRTLLKNAYWAGVQASQVDFYKADLSGASLAYANLTRAVLYGTNLSRATLSGASLVGVNFKGANLSGAKLDGADLTNATNIESSIWDEKTIWPSGYSPPQKATT